MAHVWSSLLIKREDTCGSSKKPYRRFFPSSLTRWFRTMSMRFAFFCSNLGFPMALLSLYIIYRIGRRDLLQVKRRKREPCVLSYFQGAILFRLSIFFSLRRDRYVSRGRPLKAFGAISRQEEASPVKRGFGVISLTLHFIRAKQFLSRIKCRKVIIFPMKALP